MVSSTLGYISKSIHAVEINICKKEIIDHTSHTLCTPITPFQADME